MNKKRILGIAIIGILGISAGLYMTGHLWAGSKDISSIKKVDIVIDPGHGGEDPGKVGVNDVLEKDVNLAVAKKVKKLLKKEKITVLLTRSDDRVLEAGEAYSKMEDLNRRLEMIQAAEPSLVVGIHQNSFTSEEIKGAQVFFDKKSQEAAEAAEVMQKSLLRVDPENTRVAKSDQNYYLLAKSTAPTIIVECGFLSNPEEAELLKTKEYQDQLAESICAGIKEYKNCTKESD